MKQNHADSSEIREMFDAIAPEYDRLNRLFTLGIDRIWRKKLIRSIQPLDKKKILDIATGTGDLAFDMLRKQPGFIHGVDFSVKMVELCNQKIRKRNAGEKFTCIEADVEQLPFSDTSFNIVTIAFGIRNFKNINKSLSEIHRVLQPGGTFVLLEFFHSDFARKNVLYKFYMTRLMPFVGKIISGHPWAYRYLYQSVQRFYSEEDFQRITEENKFENVKLIRLAFGIAHIVVCRKKI